VYTECPHTGGALTPILAGRADKNQEGVIYVRSAHSVDYGADYFLSEYRNQYGKTYLEDEANLRAMARHRLQHLSRFCRGGHMFEIGAACGFFLDEARAAGFSVSGLEISPFAAAHARSLGLDVREEAFPGPEPGPPRDSQRALFDAVCAFYVIEHLENQKEAFSQVSAMLKPGGAFMFALPSSFGPTLRYNPERWIQTHPPDHFADYSPSSLKRLLPHYGLRLVHTRPASYHPARARGILKVPLLFRAYARAFSFGDTMEGIAVKAV